jgi:copper chaperone CopZ
MRKLISTICVALIITSSFIGCSANKTAVQETTTKQEIQTRIYEVFGMDCPGCHGGISKLIMKIEGVESAKANWTTKQLIVNVYKNSSVDDSAIFDAIKDANFTPGKRVQ